LSNNYVRLKSYQLLSVIYIIKILMPASMKANKNQKKYYKKKIKIKNKNQEKSNKNNT